jgi:hypothetical protein
VCKDTPKAELFAKKMENGSKIGENIDITCQNY